MRETISVGVSFSPTRSRQNENWRRRNTLLSLPPSRLGLGFWLSAPLSIKGIRPEDLALFKENLENEAKENLGMAMMYTLAASAKEWLTEKFCSGAVEEPEVTAKPEDEVIMPHGEAVTTESFLAWREQFEAELALERAKKGQLWWQKGLRRKNKTLTSMKILKVTLDKKFCWLLIATSLYLLAFSLVFGEYTDG
ncbi:RWD domain-containing protein 1-like protein [Carex littledalei]|uniref:RWD domain-containing protein 1-like protein n=1 Tax=Carex littledalei TaxID=544730 RepID=A0A833RHT0_9POAL|nr:RWD domain-containing protein 1-like protein [Carex littledalei]